MPHKRKGLNYLHDSDLILPKIDGLQLASGPAVTAAVGTAKNGTLGYFEYSVQDTDFTVVDSGANGGALAVTLFTWPAAMIWVVGSLLEVSVSAAAAGIGATGNINIGVGSVAYVADGSDPATTEIDFLASLMDFTLVGGIKADQRKEGAAAGYRDATAGTVKAYLNFYVPAADISADAALTADVDFRCWYFTL